MEKKNYAIHGNSDHKTQLNLMNLEFVQIRIQLFKI